MLNALVLCGAVPVYVNPEVDQRLGISLGMKREQVAKAIAEHPKAVAVLVNNPTYYGICSDLRAIVRMAHDAGMLCLADEAHGTHFYFGGGFRCPLWRREQIWLLFPCTRAEAALPSPAFC